MEPGCTYLPYEQTGYFSKLVVDYLDERDELKPFYTFSPSKEGLIQAVKEREKFPVNRQLLSDVLHKQYEGLTLHEKVVHNLSLLGKDGTFTVCTAHQPNLLTGYLYFVYKILHAVKLAEELQKLFPEKNFVPMYYMGSEDNDLDELGVFRYGDRKYVWDANGQAGAVGRMKPEGLERILDELFRIMGPPGESYDELRNMLSKAYLHHNTIGKATQYLVNELFGRFGLIVLDPDDKELKQAFAEVVKDDLLHHTAYNIVSKETESLDVHYKSQAFPRPVNLFYLKDDLRERIEKSGAKWQVLNTSIEWDEVALMEEVDEYPERFSANVILRGLFQETILPNVAFIGGGAEVAYWLQLKELFDRYNVFYPNIQLRQSILWINSNEARLQQQLELSTADIFSQEVELFKEYISKHSSTDWHTEEEQKSIETILVQLKQKAETVDSTLRSSAEASLAKMRYQLQLLEKKMLRAEKRKMQEQLSRISRLKSALFPNNNLQERVENFTGYYLTYGPGYFDVIKDCIQPFDSSFLIIENNR